VTLSVLTDLGGFPLPFHANSDVVRRLGHDCFLPNSFPKFIVHSSYNTTLYSIGTEKASFNNPRKENDKISVKEVHIGPYKLFKRMLCYVLSRRMRLTGHVAHMEMRNPYEIIIVKPEWKRPLVRRRHRLKGNAEMRIKGLVCDCMH
jgi:hypothetical protein